MPHRAATGVTDPLVLLRLTTPLPSDTINGHDKPIMPNMHNMPIVPIYL